MKFIATELPGVIIVEPDTFGDARGYFLETYHELKYRENGIPARFVQNNQSVSRRHVLRGLHLQNRRPQAKLVRAISGTIFDVVIDIQKSSPLFGRMVTVELSGENHRQIYVPRGYAHGLAVLSDLATVEYLVDDFYDPGGELTVRWNDPALAIPWPVVEPILSAKDAAGLTVDEIQPLL